MEHGHSDLPALAQLQQRLDSLEQTVAQQQTVIAEQQTEITRQQTVIAHQAAVIVEQSETIAVYQEQLSKADEQIRLLKRAMFGQRRERYIHSPDQKMLFTPEALDATGVPSPEEAAKLADENSAEATAATAKTKKRRARGPFEFPQFLEHRRTEYPLPPEELACGCCGAERKIISTHETKRVEIEPANVFVQVDVQFTYACPACRDGSQMATPPRPPQAVEKSPFGASVQALVVTNKFVHHIPTYRQQEQLLGPMKRWLSRPLICGLLASTAQALLPIVRTIQQQVLASATINVDETPVPVLKPDHDKTAKAYLWGYAGDVDHQYVFYDFSGRDRDGPQEILANYRGYLQSDGYAVYTSLVNESDGRMIDVACHTHGRRYFEVAIPFTSHPLVHEAMVWFQQLYDIEDRARFMSNEDRRALRQAEALPILRCMKFRFDEVRPTLRPTTKLAEAIDYMLNRWDAFVRYTEDGRLSIDNNVIERLMRPVAIGRKNWLFFGSEKGGRTGAILYTVVQSARRNHVDVLPYLTDVLRRIAAIAPTDTAALEALLPDRWLADHPEHRLEEREQESREAQARRQRRRTARRLAAAPAT